MAPTQPPGFKSSTQLQGPEIQSHFRLFDLPQELQDEIFSLAYAGMWLADALKTVPLITNSLQPHISHLYHSPQILNEDMTLLSTLHGKWPTVVFEFQGHGQASFKVRDALVSKKHFRAAAQAWFRTVTFHTRTAFGSTAINHLDGACLVPMSSMHTQIGLFHEFGTTAMIEAVMFPGIWIDCINCCRSLKHLVVNIGGDFFSDASLSHLSWLRALENEDLLKVLEYHRVTTLRGLRTIEFRPRRLRVHFPGQQLMFEENVQRLSGMAQKQILANVNLPVANRQANGLYSGSKVGYDHFSATDWMVNYHLCNWRIRHWLYILRTGFKWYTAVISIFIKQYPNIDNICSFLPGFTIALLVACVGICTALW
ncbi:hypothetical protein Q7P37_002549 [Cladosporium fusiforme]